MNERVKNFTVFDVKLSQGAAMFLVLIIVKLIPQIMNINIIWFVVLLILCVLRPMYAFFLKK